ncbi:hypothetical protein EXIGLDRAFT_736535 [Exidia glandulosa HHB12029]|uniref:Concanavalin A-like lectin/glucanase n=1 Tax=Exidia glandulosa HHB12029 TaxID=1314781 RepID=A0A165JCK0_EXIGL|nr:hypothetical protein EXIGLDRAFT_736535 [Exidia glandulosa HHB12029]
MFTTTLILALAATVRAGFVDPLVMLEETDPRVICTPGYERPFRCPTLDSCEQGISWWSVADDAYRGGSMLVSDDVERASCQVFFRGSAIALYGLRVENGANGWYTVDNALPVKFTWAVENSRLGSGVTQVFRAGGLDGTKNHTLFIEIQQGPMDPHKGTGRYLASVDFFAVSDPLAATDTPTAGAAPTDYVAHNDFLPGGILASTETPSVPNDHPSPEPLPSLRRCTPFVGIIASVVAVAVGLGVLFSLARHIKRRRLAASARDEDETTVVDEVNEPLIKKDKV